MMGHTADALADDAAAAYAFRQLVAHLQQRTDVQNIEMMILSGFCRNCMHAPRRLPSPCASAELRRRRRPTP